MRNAVVVVGAGLAGLGAVRALRAQGYPGRVVLVGAERHRPYDRPPLSKEFLAGTMPRESLDLAAPDDADLEVHLRLHTTATAVDLATRTVRLAGGERVGGDGVVIATGARARTLPGAHSVPGVSTLRTLDDAIALRSQLRPGVRLVVVGGGLIGTEVAATARGLGVEVTLVEAAAVPLAAAFGPRIGAVLAQVHTEHGVKVITGVGVQGIVTDDDGAAPAGGRLRGVLLADGREVPADVVLVAIGSTPDVEWLGDSGLDVAGGVLTDADGTTGVPGVVATGDCTRRYEPIVGAAVRQEHWTNALHHPALAVAALLGRTPPAQPLTARLPYVWSDQYDLRVQFAGAQAPGDQVEVVEGSLDARAFVAVYRRHQAVVAALAVNSPRGFGRWRRELAAAL